MTVESSGPKSDESKAVVAPKGDVRFPRWLPALAAAMAKRAERSRVESAERRNDVPADPSAPSDPSPEETLP